MKKRKDGRNKGLRPGEQRELEEKIRKLIGRNFSDYQIEETLGIQPHVLRIYRQRIAMSLRVRLLAMGNQGVFDWFARQSWETIQNLEEAKVAMQNQKRAATAYVQAIRLQDKAHRDVVKLAFQLGLISRRTRSVPWNGIEFSKDRKSA